jgi:hypothetical protein
MAGKKAFERNIILNHLTSRQILVIIACVILYRYISHRGLYMYRRLLMEYNQFFH